LRCLRAVQRKLDLARRALNSSASAGDGANDTPPPATLHPEGRESCGDGFPNLQAEGGGATPPRARAAAAWRDSAVNLAAALPRGVPPTPRPLRDPKPRGGRPGRSSGRLRSAAFPFRVPLFSLALTNRKQRARRISLARGFSSAQIREPASPVKMLVSENARGESGPLDEINPSFRSAAGRGIARRGSRFTAGTPGSQFPVGRVLPMTPARLQSRNCNSLARRRVARRASYRRDGVNGASFRLC